MGVAFALLHVAGETAGRVLDTGNLRHGADYRHVTIVPIAVMVVFTTLLLIISGSRLPPFPWLALPVLVGIVALSTVQNVADNLGLRHAALSAREPVANAVPLLAAGIAFVVFPSEREPLLLALVLVGGLAVAAGTGVRDWASGSGYFVAASVASAGVLVLYKVGLAFLPPAAIFLCRLLGVLLIGCLALGPDLRRLKVRHGVRSTFAGLAYFAGSLGQLYAIDTIGLVQTALVTLLLPGVKYLSCALFLGEAVHVRQVLSSVVIAALVLVSIAI